MNKKMLASALWISSLDLNSNENITFCFAMRFHFSTFVSTAFLIQQEMPTVMFVNIKLSCRYRVGGVNLFTISKVDKTIKKTVLMR